jgi:hypothetical protein
MPVHLATNQGVIMCSMGSIMVNFCVTDLVAAQKAQAQANYFCT